MAISCSHLRIILLFQGLSLVGHWLLGHLVGHCLLGHLVATAWWATGCWDSWWATGCWDTHCWDTHCLVGHWLLGHLVGHWLLGPFEKSFSLSHILLYPLFSTLLIMCLFMPWVPTKKGCLLTLTITCLSLYLCLPL